MKKFKLFTLLFLLVFESSSLLAQKQKLSIEDAVMGYYKGLYPETLYNLDWAGENFFYQDQSGLVFKNTQGKEIRTISFQDIKSKFPDLRYLPRLSYKNNQLIFKAENTYYAWDIKNDKNISIKLPENAENAEIDKNTNRVAFTMENNLYVAQPNGGKILQVTNNKDKNIVSGQAIHRSEYGIKKGIFFSPNGNLLAFYQKNETKVTNYPLVDLNTIPATPMPIKYPMAGDPSEIAKVGIYDFKTNKTIYLDINTDDFHYLTNLAWSPDEKYIVLAEINRATTHYDLNRYDVATGKKVNTIFSYSNNIWVEPENAAVFVPNSTKNLLWISQKDGFRNIYLLSTDGKTNKQLTKHKWVVKDILGFSNDGKSVIYTGTGEDPRNTQTFKTDLKSGKTTNLTPTAGTHNSTLSEDGNYLIDEFSSLEIPSITQIIDTRNGRKTIIKTSENPLKNYAVGNIEFLDLKANDGTKLYARMIKPENFDPNKKYPVLIYVYGGPHAQLVTNSFLGGASMWEPAFASLNDYIVFTLDNRGSANRGFAFESVIHRHLGNKEIEDQMTGVEYLKSLPFVDAKRIAVHGWSFGGFMASSLMLRKPGVFTTSVAGGPVINWRMYEVMYGERYMDTPQENPEGYKENLVSNYIQNLQGKLMLITGSIDNVVVPQHSMSLLEAAVKNNIQVDFFSYPMHEHNVGGKDRVNLIEKIANYIVRNNQ
uniref:S9 family peptidase n=1 Tax=Ornithobacterium rhinotracheale TaxID=28251 RepID=UPI0039A5A175